MSDCLFCRIVAGELPANVVLDTERAFAFRDLNPQAPTHVLVVPKRHITHAGDITAEHAADVAAVFEAATTSDARRGRGGAGGAPCCRRRRPR